MNICYHGGYCARFRGASISCKLNLENVEDPFFSLWYISISEKIFITTHKAKQSKWSTRLRVQGKLHGIVCFDDIMRMIIILQNCHCGRRLPVQFHLLNPKFHWLRQIRPLCASFTDSFGIFLDAIAKAKKLICISIAQNLKQVSLTKRFFSLCNGA